MLLENFSTFIGTQKHQKILLKNIILRLTIFVPILNWKQFKIKNKR